MDDACGLYRDLARDSRDDARVQPARGTTTWCLTSWCAWQTGRPRRATTGVQAAPGFSEAGTQSMAADEEPGVNVSSMIHQPEMPPPVEEGRRASGGSSDEEQEKDADPFLVIAQVIQALNDQPTRRMKFSDVYSSSDRKNTARHAALAFRHLLTLQNQHNVDLTQDAANFKDPINIHLLM